MNQRIVELAQQAGLKKDHASDREYTSDFDWRAFAELIVRECMSVADLSKNPSGQWDHLESSEVIAKHFGVKE
jgi:hypothetical protein